MKITINKPYEISKIRLASKLAAEVLNMIQFYIKPGISTNEIDYLCNKYIIEKQQATSASLGYLGFPKSVCISINDVVCHGIPDDTKLKYGDIVNIDVAIVKDGFYGDTSKMFIVGKTSVLGERLCKLTQESLYLAINKVRPGVPLGIIGSTIQEFIEKKNLSVVRDYCGHGIGKNLHEDPQVLHYKAYDGGIMLQPGMVFTIEPMINVGSHEVELMNDGWTVKTKDHSLSAQYEHTILVTNNGCEIMTIRAEENIPNFITHKV